MKKINLFAICFLLVGMIAVLFTACGEKDDHRYILVSTDLGDITIKLYNTTPQHRDNIIKLAEDGFYDGLLFHRVIEGFMIQGGDPDSRNAPPGQSLGAGGPGYTIPAEIGANHFKGAVAAARTGDQMNPERKSSGSQFYIVQGQIPPEQFLRQSPNYTDEDIQKYLRVGGTPQLDGQYTVFGEVTKGMDVIDKIAAVQKAPGDRPTEDVKMTVTVIK